MGVFSSPVNSRGVNIFLSPGNLSNVLRQVSNNGIVAVGMTLVILTAGIDLSVGSILALGSVLCAMLLTMEGWTSASVISIPVFGVVLLFLVAWTVPALGAARGATPGGAASGTGAHRCRRRGGGRSGGGWTGGHGAGQVRRAGVLAVVPTVGLVVGALNGIIIAKGRLQPFIVTLAMMVGILGVARLVDRPGPSVVPVYAGTNATEDIEMLRALLWGVLPIPACSFSPPALIFAVLLGTTTFGRYVYAIGGNETGDAACRASPSTGSRSPSMPCPACWRAWPACSTRRSTCRGSPTPARASSSTPSPRW